MSAVKVSTLLDSARRAYRHCQNAEGLNAVASERVDTLVKLLEVNAKM
jgi:hypothetical protein